MLGWARLNFLVARGPNTLNSMGRTPHKASHQLPRLKALIPPQPFAYQKSNSWGNKWADNGDFKVSYDTASELSSGETYGAIWTPSNPSLEPPVPAKPGPKPGCFNYMAATEDYLEKVAARAGVDLAALITANNGVLSDLGASLVGVTLVLCNPRPGAIRVPGAGASRSSRKHGQRLPAAVRGLRGHVACACAWH